MSENYGDWSAQQSNSTVGPGMYESIHGRHIRTQLVVVNTQVNLNMGRDRESTRNDKNIPDTEKFWKQLGDGSGDQYGDFLMLFLTIFTVQIRPSSHQGARAGILLQ